MTTGSKAVLQRYLTLARDALLWKLEAVSEYDLRRPLTATGTNLLGTVKHLTMIERGYLGDVFDRPAPDPLPWTLDGIEPNQDMYATADESTGSIIGQYRLATVHADRTISDLELDAIGEVPWWPDDARRVTLHQIIVHLIAETNRHLGQIDILREQLDGAAGHRADVDNMPDLDAVGWQRYVATVEDHARRAAESA